MRSRVVAAALGALVLSNVGPSRAETPMKTPLKPFNVTVRVFDPGKGMDSGQDYVLPVDSPDAEHAAASTLANAASFTTKMQGSRTLPVAFTAIKVEPR